MSQVAPLLDPDQSRQAPLRIALVLETSGGGSGRHVLDLAQGLAERGQSVTVIWSPIRAQADFRDRLAALQDVKSQPLDMHRAVGPRDFADLRALASLLRRIGPFDVLHSHSSKAGALVRLLPRSIPGRRIYTPHALATMNPSMGSRARRIYGTIERILAPRADRIITVSAAERAHALSLGIAPERVTTVVNGSIPTPHRGREAARATMGLAPSDIAVGFIGRLDAQKDPLRFVDAVSGAAESTPMLRGIVIGDGPLRRAAEARAGPGTTRFLGWQDGPALFVGLDIFCMTSHYEAMPYTLLEALQVGVPVVASAVGGTDETVIDGQTGFVLPVDAPASEFAKRISELAADPQRRASFGTAARKLATNRTVERMVAETLALYSPTPGQGHQSDA